MDMGSSRFNDENKLTNMYKLVFYTRLVKRSSRVIICCYVICDFPFFTASAEKYAIEEEEKGRLYTHYLFR